MDQPQNLRNEHLQEILQCGKDPIYFIKKYVYIQHPTRGKVRFETFQFQDMCVDAFQKHRFNIVLKSRQLGLSTLCAAYVLWLAIFFRNKNILIIATKLLTAQNFTKKVKYALKHLPKWLLIPTYQHNQREIRFTNGSVIAAIPTSEDAGRSEALSLLIVDEAAFIKNFEEIWTGLYPTISRGGRAIVLSTPNGAGGQYHKLYVQAEAKQSDFNPIKLPWSVHPEQDQAWFDKETRGMSKRDIAQELECDFLSSGDTFLQADVIERLRKSCASPIKRDSRESDLYIWRDPEQGKKYVIGCDVARGDGHDYSAFHVVSATDFAVVAEYKHKCKPDKCAMILDRIGRQYNNALIAVENNNIGYMVCSKLIELEYPRLFYESAGNSAYDYKPYKHDETPGFTTSVKTRDKMLAKLEDIIRNDGLKTQSERLYKEFLTFLWNGNRVESTRDSNDDLIMSLAIAVWVIDLLFGASTAKSSNIALALARAASLSKRPNTLAVSLTNNVYRQEHNRYIDDTSWLYR